MKPSVTLHKCLGGAAIGESQCSFHFMQNLIAIRAQGAHGAMSCDLKDVRALKGLIDCNAHQHSGFSRAVARSNDSQIAFA
jgi:hypothetical protein